MHFITRYYYDVILRFTFNQNLLLPTMCQATWLTFSNSVHSILTFYRWKKGVWKIAVTFQVYIVKQQNWDSSLSLPTPCPGMPYLLGVHSGAAGMPLHWVSIAFSFIEWCNHTLYTNCQLYLLVYILRRDPIRSMIGTYYSTMCWEQHSWLPQTDSFKIYFNIVLTTTSSHLFKRLAINQDDCSFTLTVNRY